MRQEVNRLLTLKGLDPLEQAKRERDAKYGSDPSKPEFLQGL